MARRTTFTTDGAGRVTLAYDDPDARDGRAIRLFTAPARGGYVHEWHADGHSTQPCDGMARLGETLRLPPGGDLATLIRREWRRYLRRQRELRRCPVLLLTPLTHIYTEENDENATPPN